MSQSPSKLRSPEDLKTLRETLICSANDGRRCLKLCAGGSCLASGALDVETALKQKLAASGLNETVKISHTGCMGPCVVGPVMLMDDGTFYQGLRPNDAEDIVDCHLLEGKRVDRLIVQSMDQQESYPTQTDIAFFNRQKKVVLRRCGSIDPDSLEDAICAGDYQPVAKALHQLTPEQIIEDVKKSGLRGRGGAGFPTWVKWNLTKREVSDQKYVLCNADEGDPGAYMDRSVLEGDPHSVIEGMILGAYAIGASKGFAYIRAEYPLAVERFQRAINHARERGLLGEDILGSGFSFDLEIRMGSGAFVCGEETALIASIEGKRGEPRTRPPFPAHKGLWDKPTVLNNVETFANVAAIFDMGADVFAANGTEKSKGTKVFALAGSVRNTGLVEVPIGTTLGELIYEIGGGIVGCLGPAAGADLFLSRPGGNRPSGTSRPDGRDPCTRTG